MPSAFLQSTKDHLLSGLRSYAQIYFSNRPALGGLLLLVSFFDLGVGLSGLLGILVCQLCARIFSFDKTGISTGTFSYNSLMIGLALGGIYQWSASYAAVLVIGAMLSFFLSVWLAGRMGAKGLPFLSLPFLIAIWVLLLGLPNFTGVQLSYKQSFSLQTGLPGVFEQASALVDALPGHDGLHFYLRSLSAIVFQYNDLAGILIALALLLHSRMAFALSVYGFAIGYGFYHFFQGDFRPLVYSYIGFNFILSAIALGGYFIVPSWRSHLLLLFIIPVTALLLSALYSLFGFFSLPLYSLPFNVIVLLTLGALQMRWASRGLEIVQLQQHTPEANHYKTVYYSKRFAGQLYYHLYLPVMGEWHVPQGYNGGLTHREGWQHALDFDVRDEQGRTFGGMGLSLRDYYCYELPVLAPAAGYVTTVKDGVPDNAIGDANLGENWGNTIIIRHAEGLYSKLSHLKPGSLKVKEGQYVQSGELIASCGSSGRSPEPHLHFQAQATPYIGSQTLAYPLAYFLSKSSEGAYRFHSFETPAEGATVRNIIPTPALAAAFDFIPGKTFTWHIEEEEKKYQQHWIAGVDAANRRYIYCKDTGATAYCYNDGTLFYFTDFYGTRHSFLHQFYLAFQRVLLGRYRGAVLSDWLLPQHFFSPLLMGLQDFAAPFYHFLQGRYEFAFGDAATESEISILTKSTGLLFSKEVAMSSAEMRITEGSIDSVRISAPRRNIVARCEC